LLGASYRGDAVDLFPLEEVEVGQEGVWETVVSGTKIERFRLKILGVIDHFSGPQRPAILAEAFDAEAILSGPVSGMSGSPVYIDGRLVGAYAYGYTWPKEQAIIVITPIEEMLAILDIPEDAPAPLRRIPGISTGNRDRSSRPMAERRSRLESLSRQPMPLALGGFSGKAINLFRSRLESMGLSPMAMPMGKTSDQAVNELVPGAPVAGILMRGDFNAAVTGTVTWREGERLLAFGHPFLQNGHLALPMAGAEILTVVRNLQSSFKVANIGKPIGVLYQDRLTGVAGRLGEESPTLDLEIGVQREGVDETHFKANVWPHAEMFPMLVGMATYDSLTGSVQGDERETVELSLRLETREGSILTWSDVATGERSAEAIARGLYQKLDDLVNNPFGPVEVTAIDLSVAVRSGWQLSVLQGVELDRTRFKAGEQMKVNLKLRDYWGVLSSRSVSLEIPESLERGETLNVLVASGDRVDAITGKSKERKTRLAEHFQGWETQRLAGRVYLILYTEENNLSVDGSRMPALPPSISNSLSAKVTDFIRDWDQVRILSETVIAVSGVFQGEDRIHLKIE